MAMAAAIVNQSDDTMKGVLPMPISTNPNDRYTIRANSKGYSVHDEQDLLEPGVLIAHCSDEVKALKFCTCHSGSGDEHRQQTRSGAFPARRGPLCSSRLTGSRRNRPFGGGRPTDRREIEMDATDFDTFEEYEEALTDFFVDCVDNIFDMMGWPNVDREALGAWIGRQTWIDGHTDPQAIASGYKQS